jgi:hypothetical protein
LISGARFEKTRVFQTFSWGLQLKPCYKAFKTLLSKSAVRTLLESLLNLAMVKNAKTCRITAKPCIFKK